MDTTTQIREQLAVLATHLQARRDTLLAAWRTKVDSDPDLTTGTQLSRTQFDDHIPEILDSYTRRLHAWPDALSIEVQHLEHVGMTSHGLHRWQQGFRLRELTREWGYLQLCIVDEVETYGHDHPELEVTVIATALKMLTHLCVAGVSDSSDQYWRLHQDEAAGHVRDLEQALNALNSLESARSSGWHEAVHDIRGGFAAVAVASKLLDEEDITESERQQATALLHKGVGLMHDLLANLLDLARLDAGHEQREMAPFDAAALLNELCFALQPLAKEFGLSLTCAGPDSLPVVGDRIKVQRILQNLVLNALKYTDHGGVIVTWETRKESDADRWMVAVQDSGDGFHADVGLPMANQLRKATRSAHEVEDSARTRGTSSNQDEPAATSVSQSNGKRTHQAGEGIGLSIVKGLCDLLDATLELETEKGRGTTFRVTFPSHYDR